MENDALVHDLRNELHAALIWVDLKVTLKEIPQDLAGAIKGRLRACADKVGQLTSVQHEERHHIRVPSIEFLTLVKEACARKTTAELAVGMSHALKPTTWIGIESIETLELIISEIVRNASKVRASTLWIHVSDSDDLIRMYFRDNGPGVTGAKRDFMMMPAASRGRGGEGVKLLEGLVNRCRGAVSWHTISNKGMIVKVLLPKTTGESVNAMELNEI